MELLLLLLLLLLVELVPADVVLCRLLLAEENRDEIIDVIDDWRGLVNAELISEVICDWRGLVNAELISEVIFFCELPVNALLISEVIRPTPPVMAPGLEEACAHMPVGMAITAAMMMAIPSLSDHPPRRVVTRPAAVSGFSSRDVRSTCPSLIRSSLALLARSVRSSYLAIRSAVRCRSIPILSRAICLSVANGHLAVSYDPL